MKFSIACFVLATSLGFTVQAAAQQAFDLSRDRIVTNAEGQKVEGFAEPSAPKMSNSPPSHSSDVAIITPPAQSGGLITISGLDIVSDASIRARASAVWQPPFDEKLELHLTGNRGTIFDADWVNSQFAENGLLGIPVGSERLVALVQMINREIIANGYLNSGLLITGLSVQEGTQRLNIRIVWGGLVSAKPGELPIEVVWAEGRTNGLNVGYISKRLAATQRVPLSGPSLEREFRLLADDPAIASINVDLRPGTMAGQATLGVTVKPQDRVDLYSSFANSRSPSVGGERVAVGASIRNALIAGDVFTAEFGLTGDRADYNSSYAAPLSGNGTWLTLRGGKNDAAVVDKALQILDIKSREWNVEAGIAHRFVDEPLLPAPEGGWISAERLTFGASVARRSSRTYLFGIPFSFSPGAVDGISTYTVTRFTADWLQRGISHVIAVSVTGTLGLDGSGSDIPGVIRPSERFKTAVVQANYARRLNHSGLELRLHALGQMASSQLYSGELLSLGGEFSVRGYRENLLLADSGAVGSIELVQPFTIGRRNSNFNHGAFSIGVFADGGLARNHSAPKPRPGEIASVGAVLNWVPSDAISASISYGEALINPVGLAQRNLQDHGVHFRITVHLLRLFH